MAQRRKSIRPCENMDDAEPESSIDNSSTIINKMATLYAEKVMSDIILVVGNAEYPSHKLILCASSDVFQIMLHDSHWSESSQKRIILGETPSCAAVFEDFLKYLYTGKIHLDFATVLPIVSLADKYNVKDLLKLGLDFMQRNISTACKKNQIVSWFQITLCSGHHRVSTLCSDFIKANFEVVSRTIDFPNMEPELLVSLVKSNDLVIEDEFKLFECISSWLKAKKIILVKSGEENVDLHFDRYVDTLLQHVRFPMMTKSQLADLLLSPLSKTHTHLIVERIREGLSYHKNQLQVDTKNYDPRLFTPRLYTTERFCASLSIDHFFELPSYHFRSLLFSSQKFIPSYLGEENCVDWSVDLYPKGVWFQRCLTVYLPSGKEVPERILKTVRVAVTTKEVNQKHLKVKIGILVIGNQDNFEHVRCVRTRNYVFGVDDEIVNFDDVVDFENLISEKPKSNFLSGEDRASLKILVTITPLSKLSSLSVT